MRFVGFLFARWQHHQLVMGAHVIPQLHHKADDRIDRAPKTRQKRSHHFHIGTRHGYNLVGWFGITQHRHFDFRWKVRMSMTSSILDSFDKMFKQGKYSIQEVRPWNCSLSLSEQTNWENMWHCAALACFFVLFPKKKIVHGNKGSLWANRAFLNRDPETETDLENITICNKPESKKQVWSHLFSWIMLNWRLKKKSASATLTGWVDLQRLANVT